MRLGRLVNEYGGRQREIGERERWRICFLKGHCEKEEFFSLRISENLKTYCVLYANECIEERYF